MISRGRLTEWIVAEIRRAQILSALAALAYLPFTLILIGVTWLIVLVLTWYFSSLFKFSGYVLATSIVLTCLLLILLWWENRRLERSGGPIVDAIRSDFSEGDGSLGPQVLNVLVGLMGVMSASIGLGGALLMNEVQATAHGPVRRLDQGMSAPKLMTLFLFLVPMVAQQCFQYAWKFVLLGRIDPADTATVFQILLDHEHKVPFTELEKLSTALRDPTVAFSNLAFFNGVLYLVGAPAGIALSTDLRRELQNL